MLRFAILGLVSKKPMYGYEIKKICEKTLSSFWNASLSQIYPELARLERDGLVARELVYQKTKPNRSVYSITQEGKKALKDWVESQVKEKFVKDDFLLKFFFSEEEGKEALAKRLEEYKRLCQKKLDHLMEMKKELRVNLTFCQDLSLTNGIMHLKTDLSWIKMVLPMISS
jgi:DNA-binding PadR family transcriptional regulator